MFSSAELPSSFVETDDGVFTNLAYKKQPQNALTVVVDLGIGGFSIETYKVDMVPSGEAGN